MLYDAHYFYLDQSNITLKWPNQIDQILLATQVWSLRSANTHLLFNPHQFFFSFRGQQCVCNVRILQNDGCNLTLLQSEQANAKKYTLNYIYNKIIVAVASLPWMSTSFSCAWRTPSCITHWLRNYHWLTSVVTGGGCIYSVI